MMVCRVEHNRRRLRMHVNICENRLERGRGMLLRARPGPDTAYLLRNCRAVHTVGMLYRIDLLFCDSTGRILRIDSAVPPCRFRHEYRARQVWELAAGTALHWGWRVGDEIQPC